MILPAVLAVAWHCAAPSPPPADTLIVTRLASAPIVDGCVREREYAAPPLRLATAAGDVRIWLGRYGDFLHLAAHLPDSTFYWGDDLVVSLNPSGAGGTSPNAGDRQWYLRRVLDSSFVVVAEGGRWYPEDRRPAMLGPVRHGADWDVASSSSAAGWTVELRVRMVTVQPGRAAPRLAFRTYNDGPSGWWSWPAAPAGVPPQRVERSPDLWIPLRLP